MDTEQTDNSSKQPASLTGAASLPDPLSDGELARRMEQRGYAPSEARSLVAAAQRGHAQARGVLEATLDLDLTAELP